MRAKGTAVALLVAAVLVAGCTSSGGKKAAGSTTTTSKAPTTTGATTSTVPATTVPLSPALPTPATSGALHLAATIALPLTIGPVFAAEAPDGAVFVAQSNTPVYVIDGYQAPAVAEHVAGGAAALAADANDLYAASYTSAATTVFSYGRASGVEVRQWSLPGINAANASNAQLISLVASGGALWVLITAGNDVDVYRIDPTSSASPTQVATSLGAAVGPDGSLYYERTDEHLVRRDPSGSLTVGPVLADAPNGEGGGVQYIDTVAGGLLWVDEPAGQGLDATFSTFNTTTLAAVGGPFPGNTNESGITDTLAGTLDVTDGNATISCPMQGTLSEQCLFRISSTAALSDPTPVGSGFALLGPYPAVVAVNAANTMLQLDRFS
jgi:hypothetical protein